MFAPAEKPNRKDHKDLEERISYSLFFAVFAVFVVHLFFDFLVKGRRDSRASSGLTARGGGLF